MLPFPSDSEFVEFFFRPSLGDLALVVGIYISIVSNKIKKLNSPSDIRMYCPDNRENNIPDTTNYGTTPTTSADMIFLNKARTMYKITILS